MPSPYKEFAKDVGTVGVTTFLVNLQAIILLPVLTKTLGVHEYGLWVQILVTLGLAIPILTLGLPVAVVRFLAGKKDRKEIQEGVLSSAIFIFLLSSLAAVGIILISKKVFNFLPWKIITLLALIIPFWCTSQIFLSLFRAYQEFKKYSIFLILQAYREVALISYFILSGFGLTGAVLSVLIIRVLLFRVMSYYVLIRTGLKTPRFSILRKYSSVGLPTLPEDLSRWMITSGDRYIIGFFLGATYVGYYNPGYILGNMVFVLATPLILILPSVLSKYFEENRMKEVETPS